MAHELIKGGANGSRFMDSGAIEAHVGETQSGVLASLAREEAEVRSSLILARQFPRNEGKALQRVIAAVESPEFAEVAIWSLPRGKQTITGPSVHLAREMGKLWGNIQFGFRVVTMSEDEVHIAGYAWDAETNTRVTHEMRFPRLIYRKNDGWREPNADELLELVNRNGAKAERNAIFKVLPRDVVATAESRARETLLQASREELNGPAKRKAAVQTIEKRFRELGVHRTVLEAYLGHPLEDLTPEENANLRQIRTAIVEEGRSPRSFFDFDAGEKSENEDDPKPKRKLTMDDLRKGKQPNETRPKERQEAAKVVDPEQDAGEEETPVRTVRSNVQTEPEAPDIAPEEAPAPPKKNGKSPVPEGMEDIEEKSAAFVAFRKAAKKIVKDDTDLIDFTRAALTELGFDRSDINFGSKTCRLAPGDVELVLMALESRKG